jgi:hypothetical protein
MIVMQPWSVHERVQNSFKFYRCAAQNNDVPGKTRTDARRNDFRAIAHLPREQALSELARDLPPDLLFMAM